MKFSEKASNGTCPTCGKEIDWGQEYCNNCRPPIDKITVVNWVCKCGNVLDDDRNFCVQCDRERPL